MKTLLFLTPDGLHEVRVRASYSFTLFLVLRCGYCIVGVLS